MVVVPFPLYTYTISGLLYSRWGALYEAVGAYLGARTCQSVSLGSRISTHFVMVSSYICRMAVVQAGSMGQAAICRMDDQGTLLQKLQKHRQDLKLSYEHIAVLTGYSPNYVSQVLRNKRGRVTVETLCKISNSIGIDVGLNLTFIPKDITVSL